MKQFFPVEVTNYMACDKSLIEFLYMPFELVDCKVRTCLNCIEQELLDTFGMGKNEK